MKSTREKILRTLLAFPGSTINDLAEAVGINGISIRHHLTALEAEDLVISSEERHGVGRPRLIYSLTEKGTEKFPTSYLQLTRRLLGILDQRMSSEELKSILKAIAAEIAEPFESDLNEKSLDERINLLKKAMTKEGYIVETESNDDFYTITSLSCPYYRIGMDHPVICNLDQALIERFVSTPVKIQSCICEGADRCTYQISRNPEKSYD